MVEILFAKKDDLDAHIGTGGGAHADVTTLVDGFMTAVDKTKLDGIGAGATPLPAPDTTSIVEDPVDTTKEMRIDVGAVATGTIRVLTMPDQDIDLTPSTGAFEAADAGLLSIAGLTTAADRMIFTTASDVYSVATLTQAGRDLIDDANVAAQRTTLGLVIGTNVQAEDAGLTSIAALATAADRMIFTTALDVYAVATLTSAGRDLLDDANTAAQRTTLGLVIGTDVQAEDAGLTSIAGLTTAADRMIFTTGSDAYAVATLTLTGRNLIDDASTAAQRTTLGLVIGTDVQAEDAGLTSIAGLTTLADRMIFTTASDAYAVTTLTGQARTLLADASAAAQRTTIGAPPDPVLTANITNGAVDNTKLSDMVAWTVKLRNAGTTGDPGDVLVSALTEEATPASGDWILGEVSTGELRKYNVGNLPAGSTGGLKSVQVFTGSGTWTRPAGIVSVRVQVVGGGGDGGNGGASNAAGGGGGGGYSEQFIAAAASSETITVGSAGGTSSFGSNATATGGATGATSGAGALGGTGGVGSGGDVNVEGSDGGSIGVFNQTTEMSGGNGGNSVLGGGGAGSAGITNGLAGNNFGGGGGGGADTEGHGNGAAGVVIVWEYS